MQVMIRFSDGVEFQRLCEHFTGGRGNLVQDFMMATAPGQGDRVCVFHIDDDTPLATWIHLQHPEWIDYVWIAKAKSADPQDPNRTFNQLVAEDLDERRANTTP